MSVNLDLHHLPSIDRPTKRPKSGPDLQSSRCQSTHRAHKGVPGAARSALTEGHHGRPRSIGALLGAVEDLLDTSPRDGKVSSDRRESRARGAHVHHRLVSI